MSTEPVASPSQAGPTRTRRVPLAQLWQVPLFLVGLLAVLVIGSARPLRHAADSCLVEKALAAANRVYALAQGRVVFEAPTSAPNITAQLERAYLGGKG